jgi:hypothetical protein
MAQFLEPACFGPQWGLISAVRLVSASGCKLRDMNRDTLVFMIWLIWTGGLTAALMFLTLVH